MTLKTIDGRGLDGRHQRRRDEQPDSFYGGVDVGNERSWIARLDALVSVRADNELDTILTTNLTAGEFETTYGERVLDRMRGDGSCWHEFAGDSLRASDVWSPEGR